MCTWISILGRRFYMKKVRGNGFSKRTRFFSIESKMFLFFELVAEKKIKDIIESYFRYADSFRGKAQKNN